MNAHHYKLIFSKVRGMLIAVGETASSHNDGAVGESGARSSSSTHRQTSLFGIKQLTAALLIALCGLNTSTAQQITVDPNQAGSKPVIGVAGNGVPIENIVAPNAQGVSLNQFNQFNVGANGLILNNSGGMTQTALGGFIQGNPMLGNAAAATIINQVTGPSASAINGATEIAGRKANYILANPNGLNVNGGSFINAARVTLTTGTPQFNNGALTGVSVAQGNIAVNGQGLNATGADKLTLITRAAQINAQVWANQSETILGANQVAIDGNGNTAGINAQTGTGAAPQFALDVSSMGSMYAGQMRMVGTEAGLGVNNGGKLYSDDGLQLDVNGNIRNTGAINGGNNAQIKSTGLTNSGSLTSVNNLVTNTTGAVDNSGQINAGSVQLDAASLTNSGTISQSGAQAFAIQATSLDNQNGRIGIADITATDSASAPTTSSNSSAAVISTGQTSATPVTNNIVTNPVVLNDGHIRVNGALNNSNGTIDVGGPLDVNVSTLNNTSGRMQTADALTVKATSLNNTSGTIKSQTSATITSAQVSNTDAGLIQANQLTVHATTIDNSRSGNTGGLIGEQSLALSADGSLNNTAGYIAGGQLTLSTPSLTNTQGSIVTGSDLALSGSTLDNQQGSISAKNLTVTPTTLNNQQGSLNASDTLTVNAATINNQGGQLTGDKRAIIRSTTLNNQNQGLIQAPDLDIESGNINNTDSGLTGGIIGSDTLKIAQVDTLDNRTGYIAGGQTSIQTKTLTNSSGTVLANDLTLTANGIGNDAGSITAYGNANLTADSLNNQKGLVQAGKTASLAISTIDNQNTRQDLASAAASSAPLGIQAGTVKLTGNLNNNNGQVLAGSVTSTGQTLTNQGGQIYANDIGITTSGQLDNSSGTIIADNALTLDTASLLNTDGKAHANDALTLTVHGNHSSTGQVSSANNLTLNVDQDFTHTAGSTLSAAGKLDVHANNITNQANASISAGHTALTATNALTNDGTIDGGLVELRGNTVTNNSKVYGGDTDGNGGIVIGADTLTNNENAVIASRADMAIGARVINNNKGALIQSLGNFAVGGTLGDANANYAATGQAEQLNNRSATIESTGNMALSIKQIRNTNELFKISANPVVTSVTTHKEYQVGADGNDGVSYTAHQPFIGNKYDASEIKLLGASECAYKIAGCWFVPEGDRGGYPGKIGEQSYSKYYIFDYTKTLSQDTVESSAPASIISGGDLTLETSYLLNDKSKIVVAGKLTGTVGDTTGDASQLKSAIDNIAATGFAYTTVNGTVTQSLLDKWKKNFKNKRARKNEIIDNNYTAGTQAVLIDLGVDEFRQNAGTQNIIGQAGTQTNNSGNEQAGTQASLISSPINSVEIGDGKEVRSVAFNGLLPSNVMFSQHGDPAANYLIETDPAFTNKKQFLSSDYMLAQLAADPTHAFKRIGDGFYEQKLINDQVITATGKRFIGDYSSNEAQYKALMNNGVAFGKAFGLTVGTALSPEQMRNLTTDLVWMVEETVTLADGTTQTVLVPKVYLATNVKDLKGDGSLIAAKHNWLDIKGDLTNSGTFAGTTSMDVTANNIHNNGGTIGGNAGGIVNLRATDTLNNTGGSLRGGTAALSADTINIASTTQTTSSGNMNNRTTRGYSSTRTAIDQVGTVEALDGDTPVFDDDGQFIGINPALSITATKGLNLTAANLVSNGSAQLVAENITSNTVDTGFAEQIVGSWSSKSKSRESFSDRADVGSSIQTKGGLTMVADKAIDLKAVTAVADGAIVLVGDTVSVTEGRAIHDDETYDYRKQTGFLSKKTTLTENTNHSDTTIGSQLIGDSVNILSTGDATVRGSTVFGTNGVMIDSEKGNINIEAATNQYSQYNHILEKSSGLGGTGTGFSYGSRSNEQGKTSTATGHTGSTIASGSGDIDLSAHKGTLTVAGSEVNSLAGDIHGIAQNIAITDVQNTSSSDGFTKFKQTGVSVGVASPLLDLAQGLIAVADQAGKAKGGTQQGAVAASGALAAYNAYRAIDGINKFVPTSNVGGTAGAGLLSVGISVSLGTSKNESKTHTESTASQGSSLSADNISLTATGLGKADDSLEHNTGSDITVSNSSIKAKNNLSLKADDDVNLLAGKDTSAEKSTNKSSSASVGVTFGVGSSNGISFQAGFSVGKGKATGNGTSYANSHVEAGNLLSIESGDDTNLLGAQAKGQTVKAKVGGDLNIISLQDVNHYDSKQTNGGVSVSICVPPICVGTSSVSGNFSQEKMKSNYAGVAEQSGIIAGTGGFEIDVKGNTDLKGGAIVSAADASKNHLTTGTLTTSDIKNTSSYKASSMGISASYSPSGGGIGNTGISAGAPSFMNASDKDASITRAGISAGTVEITNQSAQTALTGQTSDQTIAELNRDTTPAEQLKDLWSEDKKAEIRNGFEIVKTLGQNTSTFMSIMASDIDAAKKAKDEIGNKILTLADGTPAIDQTTGQSVTIADLNDPRYEAFVAANPGVAQALGDYNNASAHYTTLDNIWGNGGYGSMILTGLVGAASGNVTGSGTALLQNTAINVVRQYGANEIKGIADGFMTDGTPNAESETIRGLLHSIAGCAGAAATGGDCASAAAGSAATVALNNLIGTDTTHMTAAQKQAYSNLIGTIVGGVTSAVGGDAGAAQLASKVEVDNNYLTASEWSHYWTEMNNCPSGATSACSEKLNSWLKRRDLINSDRLIKACSTATGSRSGCNTELNKARASFGLTEVYLNDSDFKNNSTAYSSVSHQNAADEVRVGATDPVAQMLLRIFGTGDGKKATAAALASGDERAKILKEIPSAKESAQKYNQFLIDSNPQDLTIAQQTERSSLIEMQQREAWLIETGQAVTLSPEEQKRFDENPNLFSFKEGGKGIIYGIANYPPTFANGITDAGAAIAQTENGLRVNNWVDYNNAVQRENAENGQKAVDVGTLFLGAVRFKGVTSGAADGTGFGGQTVSGTVNGVEGAVGNTAKTLSSSALNEAPALSVSQAVFGKNLNAATVKEANALNATYNGSPPWPANTKVVAGEIPAGTQMQMIVNEGQLNLIKNQNIPAYGEFATFNNVGKLTDAEARNVTALAYEFKKPNEKLYVITLEVTKPMPANVGLIGSQSNTLLGGTFTGSGGIQAQIPKGQGGQYLKFVVGSATTMLPK